MKRPIAAWSLSVLGLACAAAILTTTRPTLADDKKPSGPDPKLYRETVDRAMQYLARQQSQNGALSAQAGIGPTALATLGLLKSGRSVQDPQVAKGLSFIEQSAREDGGIYSTGSRFANYETCIALLLFKEANREGKYDKLVAGAEAYIRKGQWDESKGKEKSDLYYGGAGYGGSSRPDLSNTAFFVDALEAAGADPKDEAIQRALVFISRCQNLESEHNTTPLAAKVNDGGFYYSCAISQQEETRASAEGGLRSYGAMTYAGLKSMVYAGLSKDDPRVKAATDWIRKHYDVTSNPGMGQAGLYYYYHTFAKALDALGQDQIEDATGISHDWRRELTEELARRQKPDGSWVNEETRWLEGDPNLVTAFALLALSYCNPPESSAANK